MDEFLKRLDPHLSKPEFCATIIATRLFHQIQTQLLVEEIENLLAEARQALIGDAEDEEDERLAPIAMEHLQRFLNEALPMDWQVYDHMLERSQIQRRHSFVASEYTLFLNREELRQLVKPTEILIAESAKRPDLLFKIEPRTMEKLIADIFRSFGYQVELTSQTRDGGKDVVCLSRAHGIPLKLALEVKRYAPDRPIAVDLVRSFVGANAEIKANKLIYVSTSGYTKDATDYAGLPLNSHLLELKGLDDVIEWCRDCSYKRFGKRLFLE
jgi:HJR/Mrr/RecB family endonuclease